MNYSNQLKDLMGENGRLREDVGRLTVEANMAKAKLAAIENEQKAADDQRDEQAKAAQMQAAEAEMMRSLKAYGSVTKTERGIVVTLPESFWSGTRSSTLVRSANSKLASIGEMLVSNPDYRLTVESHTDNKGVPEQIQTLTDRRAYAVAEAIAAAGNLDGRIVAKGYGASVPVAPNTTNANRAKNRRIQLIFSL